MIRRLQRIYRIRQRRRRHRDEWAMANLRALWHLGMLVDEWVALWRTCWREYTASVSSLRGALGNCSSSAEASRPRA